MKNKVLVLGGGLSNEREVSLRSAANVTKQLRSVGCMVIETDPAAADFDLSEACKGVDIVMPILHGAGAEDGGLQAQLERLGIPFLGSGSAACALTFDKARYRDFVAGQGVQMAAGEVVDRRSFARSKLRKKPYVLKPREGGSSVDTLILHNLADEPKLAYFDQLFTRYETMLLERLIEGQELTVGVLGDAALPIILVVPPAGGTFDYENKYNGQTQEIVNPRQIAPDVQTRAQELALRLHRMTGCRHLSRSDMILTPDGELYVLETNTIPGMTEQSLFPKMAAAAGITMPVLVEEFVSMVLQD